MQGFKTFAPRAPWDYLGYTGTVAAVLLALQFTSGIFLLFHYTPEPDQAFASLQTIRNDVPFGLFYSNLHAICAKLLILAVFVHLARIMIVSAHRGPRARQWYVGVALLLGCLLSGFSGYLLPWSQQSYWAAVIGTEAVRVVPILGDAIFHLLRGGDNMTASTLHRFFGLHVAVLPISILVLIVIHVRKVLQTGVIAPPDTYAAVLEEDCTGCGKCVRVCEFNAMKMVKKDERALAQVDKNLCNACRACLQACPAAGIAFASDCRDELIEPIFPNNIIHRLLAVVASLIALFTGVFFLSALILGEKVPANPMLTPDRIKPDWYFLAAYQVLRKLPSKNLGLAVLLALWLLLFFLPRLDRTGPRAPSRRPVYLFLVGAAILGFIVLTVWGYM